MLELKVDVFSLDSDNNFINFSNVFFLIKSIIEHTINTIYTLSSISPNNATPEIPALLKTTAHNQSLTYLLSCINIFQTLTQQLY